MRIWPFRGRTEHRQAPYVDAIVRAILDSAEGESSSGGARTGDVLATSAVETACQLYAAAFAAADVEGARAARFGAAERSDLARALIRRGAAVYLLDTEGGMIRFIRAATWDVIGGYRPQSWSYRVDLPGPSVTYKQQIVPAAGVLHFTYATGADRPWEGIAPVDYASLSARLHANLEQALTDESGGHRGYVLPMPAGVRSETVANLKADLRNLKGRTTLVESTAGGFGQGADRAPPRDWVPQRIGPNWPQAITEARREAAHSVLAACGVPLALVEPGDAQGAREAWRRFLHGAIAPLAARVAEELSEKLEASIRFTFDGLFASDVQGRARAYQSLTGGGMAPERAAVLAGLTE